MITHIGRLLFGLGVVLGVALAAPAPRWDAATAGLATLAEGAKDLDATVAVFTAGADEKDAAPLKERVLQVLQAHGVGTADDDAKDGPAATHVLRLQVDDAGMVQATLTEQRKAPPGGRSFATAPEGKPTGVAPASFPLNPTWPRTFPLWVFFAFVGAIGAGLWRYGARKQALLGLSEGGDEENPFFLLERLVAPIRKLGEDLDSLDEASTLTRVDELLDGYILPFATVRQKVIDRLGMKEGSEILVVVAYGERMLNRVWSAASDDHMPEARACFPDALAAFEEAARLGRQALQPEGTSGAGTGGPSGAPVAAKDSAPR